MSNLLLLHVIKIIFVLFSLPNCDETLPSPQLASVLPQCIFNLRPLEQFTISNKLEFRILRCFCDCDKQKASRQLWQAQINYDSLCTERISSNSGLCIEKLEGHLHYKNCPRGAYAHCLIDCKAITIYDITILEFIVISKQLTIDERNRVELKNNEEKFNYKNKDYHIGSVICDQPPGRYFLHFKNKNDDHDQWIETLEFSESNIKVMKEKWFILSNDTENIQRVSSLLEFDEGVCLGDDSSVTLAAPLQLHGNGAKIWSSTITGYEMKSNEVMQVFYTYRHAVDVVTQATSTASTLTTAREQSSSTSHSTTTLKSPEKVVTVNDKPNSDTDDQTLPTWLTALIIIISVVVIFGGEALCNYINKCNNDT